MKLLVVTQTLDTNDPVLGFFHRWILEFAKNFEKVTVIALNVGEHTLPANVSVHSLGKDTGAGKGLRITRYVSLLYSLRNEYTHVFAHMNPEYVIGGGLLWRLLGKKVGFWYVHGAVSLRLQVAAFFAHAIFTASKESCRLKSVKVKVVGHGIDTDAFSPKHVPHPPTVISIGRFSPSKRLEVIISAMQTVKTSMPGSLVRIMGVAGTPADISYAEKIKAQAATAEVIVDMPVLHADIPSVLHVSDVFLNASMTSSIDKAVLEAMACGVVPVTSNIAFRDMLLSRKLYIEATPEAFSERTVALLGNGEERKKLAIEMREEIVTNHSLQRLARLLAEMYRSL